jgi:hypothetical protein
MAEASGPRRLTLRTSRRAACRSVGALLLALWSVAPTRAHAEEAEEVDVPTIGKPRGRPRVKLDRLTFPPDIPGAASYVRHLERALKQEARRADWGAGRGSTIVFRFTVEELTLRPRGTALEVRCSARGDLPKRRRARSRLVYSGDPQEREELVKRVLGIVARGVVTRLSDLERTRRER